MAWVALSAPAGGQTSADASYRLGPNDQIRIVVLEDANLNVERRVSSAGTVVIPLVGSIDVGGKTVEEVKAGLKAALERDFLRQATVDVGVVDARSQPISIMGAVKNPGTVYLGGTWRLSQAITAAGGVAQGNQGVVEIRRQASNGLSDRLRVSLTELLEQGDETLDVPIMARDVINVLEAADITVYFLGEVRTQGAITISGTESATLLTAIARAGGLTDRAANRLVIRRNREGAEPLEMTANYKRILAGSDPDLALEDGDLIVVKEAFL